MSFDVSNSFPILRLRKKPTENLSLVFQIIEVFGYAWVEPLPYSAAVHYTSFFSHLAKYRCATHTIHVMSDLFLPYVTC